MFETIIAGAITGIGCGFGTAIGTYFSNKLVIRHLDQLEKKLKEKEKGVN